MYDYLIDFVLINKEFFIKVKTYKNKCKKDIPLWINRVWELWRKIFNLLECMTKDNSETQRLMWKYKEEFAMKELGSIEQDWELDFVLAIINDSPESVKMNQSQMNISRAR